ncbi:NADPH-dependent assimilatory sulfite reductase flavoprotein subunit [Rosenbergiella australiborealis]|uniref:Sulfite reductase [NADPH] flavoprotein alpha-component n=1 Tax=Rosenbergiella australiborealis TaxID=1544696 RepID=A0ABS5T6J7_9GAMM|nr:NADPH-dependent assimilatory sulfite reductase flavoprotein subunit [Rosenbergiella australiborealis]MBT0727974.1 NADPH-dependent assimilatory sulfite reductase flavoprotein subunit [Rosenbergiella australiborealis]
MTNQVPQLPLSAEQLARLQEVTQEFTSHQLAWLSGYYWGRLNDSSPAQSTPVLSSVAPEVAPLSITLISASQTGNARRLAEQLRDDLLAATLQVNLVNAADYKFKQIASENIVLVVTSTQGEGEAPEEAVAFHKYLHSKKAPALPTVSFAVFGLGDSSYEFFCQAGKDFDQQLAALGAERLLPRVDADVDYTLAAEQWRADVVTLLKARVPSSSSQALAQASLGNSDTLDSTPYSKESPLTASLAVSQKITGRDSDRDIRHIEIDISESGLRYQAGDALGVWFKNDPALVREMLELLWIDPTQTVMIEGESLVIAEALRDRFELTVNSAKIVEQYAHLSANEALLALVKEKGALQEFAQQWPIADMIRHAPAPLSAEQLVGLLRPLTPRLYSISSSQAEVEDEVHITVGVVRYEIEGRARTGGASGFLADQLQEDDVIDIFIEHNDNFRLPADGDTPVIMIGPGTGIAPFRSFIQQRDNDGAQGPNWLFFGNPHFTEDFLYQVEWQKYVKQGLLTRIDLAWSRDQAEKVYVQDKLREQGEEVWRWIEQGAHIYVCGDATRMAKDVENTLLAIIAEYGGMDTESADEYLSDLRIARRYQRDVY